MMPSMTPARSRERDITRLMTLFTFDNKRHLESYARNVTIFSKDFVNLILAARHQPSFPFRQQSYYGWITPPAVVPTANDLSALRRDEKGMFSSPALRKTTRKLGQFVDQTGPIAAHAFYVPGTAEWHMFCFDHRDERPSAPNHWEHGPHVHFINWLWTAIDHRLMWERLTREHEKPNGALHIRFSDFGPDDPAEFTVGQA
jgi:hypothetical protein